MTLALRRGVCQTFTCLKEFRRFRGKVNIRKPRAPHFEKALYLELTKPWFISQKKGKSPEELCKGHKEVKVDIQNPFQKIIANELYQHFTNSKLIIFYHHNSSTQENDFKAYAMFKKESMLFKKYGKKTMEMAIEGTPYQAALDFYVSHNMMLFSPESEIKKVLQITKKCPQLVILAAILEGKFISKDELIKFSEIPNLQAAQASLVQTLNGVANQLSINLISHQQILISNLNERFKQLQEETN